MIDMPHGTFFSLQLESLDTTPTILYCTRSEPYWPSAWLSSPTLILEEFKKKGINWQTAAIGAIVKKIKNTNTPTTEIPYSGAIRNIVMSHSGVSSLCLCVSVWVTLGHVSHSMVSFEGSPLAHGIGCWISLRFHSWAKGARHSQPRVRWAHTLLYWPMGTRMYTAFSQLRNACWS